MEKSFKIKEISSLDDLLNIINHLRDPKHGCEWDIKQTAKTLSPHIIEEAYELVEALEAENTENIIDELGDVLLQVIFQCQIATENKLFKFRDVVDKAAKKMIRRHPHIFGEQKEKRSIEEQKNFGKKSKQRKEKKKEKKNLLLLSLINLNHLSTKQLNYKKLQALLVWTFQILVKLF